jgi:hypothetical protein
LVPLEQTAAKLDPLDLDPLEPSVKGEPPLLLEPPLEPPVRGELPLLLDPLDLETVNDDPELLLFEPPLEPPVRDDPGLPPLLPLLLPPPAAAFPPV